MIRYAFPRQPDFSFRVYDGEERRRRDQAASLRRLAEFLDSRYELPGGWRVGWDGIIGLIPGAGDLATSALSFYILARAAALGAPASVLGRMALNIFIDNLFDVIPIVGNLFDFVWKSNQKNVRLLERYLSDPHRTVVRSRVGLILGVGLVVITGLALVALSAWALISVIGWLGRQGGGW